MEAISFKLNPCGPCVDNKMIHDKQMTITWNVDDIEVPRADKYFFTLSFNGPSRQERCNKN